MNAREKRLAIILTTLLSLTAIVGGYMIIYVPWADKKDQIARLKTEMEDKQSKQTQYVALAKQYEGFKAMSLPAEVPTARREYDLMLQDLLTKAGAPKESTVNSKTTQQNAATIPTIPSTVPGSAPGSTPPGGAKDRPAYQKVVSEIKLVKVDLRILEEFLRMYHNVQLLHHISTMKIQRKDEPGSAAARRNRTDRSDPEQWKDLEVTITSEALILDGAEARSTLFTVPKDSTLRLFGGLAYAGMISDSSLGTKIAKAQTASTPKNSPTSRDYAMLVGRDIFHGPIPIEKEESAPPPPPPVIKENLDRFIKLNEITRRSDGSAKFEIRDQASNFVYTGVFTPKGEKTEVEISKNWFGPSGKAISDYKYKKELIITDDNKTASNYTFKVVAIDGVEGIILSGPELAKRDGKPATSGAPSGGNRPNFGGGRGGNQRTTLPKPILNSAITGGWIASLPSASETLYYLKNGGSLFQMKKLNGAEVMEIVKRNTANGMNPYLNADVALPLTEPVAELDGEK